jgi:hypothetical protein
MQTSGVTSYCTGVFLPALLAYRTGLRRSSPPPLPLLQRWILQARDSHHLGDGPKERLLALGGSASRAIATKTMFDGLIPRAEQLSTAALRR